ncbi:MAG: response regulator [Polyangiaceae bacterium]|nr:response regulator [Polyangiaceae bacterium]
MAVKILVVDDSATMRKIMEMTFAGESAEVVTVDSADAAIKKATELRPNVVFADSSGIDGYAVAQAVKSNPALSETAVIVLASQHSAYDEAKGRAAGVDEHVLKPFDSQALLDKVQDVLGRPRARAAGGAAKSAAAAPVAAPAPVPAAANPSATAPGAAFPRPAMPSTPGGAAPGRPAPVASASPLGASTRKPTVAFGSPSIPQSPPGAPARPSRPVLELAEDAPSEASRPAAIEPAPPRSPTQPLAASARTSAPVSTGAPLQPARPRIGAPTSAATPGAPAAPAPRAPAAPPSPAAAPPAAAPAVERPGVAAQALAPMATRLAQLGLTKDQIEGVLALSKEIVEQAVWEVVPELAETLIKEEIRRLPAE